MRQLRGGKGERYGKPGLAAQMASYLDYPSRQTAFNLLSCSDFRTSRCNVSSQVRCALAPYQPQHARSAADDRGDEGLRIHDEIHRAEPFPMSGYGLKSLAS
jgi:hypothetical protein